MPPVIEADDEERQAGWGLTSIVLAMIGLMLFFLPILGGPISSAGLFFGIVGLILASIGGVGSLRWSVGGVALSSLALAINVAILYGPTAGLPARYVPPAVPIPDHSYIPPPARFEH